MPNASFVLPLQHEGSAPMRLVLEPLCKHFTIQPGQKIEIHAICNDQTTNRAFTVAPNDKCLVIYAPGEIAGFVDQYVTCEGARLTPLQDQNV